MRDDPDQEDALALGPETRLFTTDGPSEAIAVIRYSLGHMEAERYIAGFLAAAEVLASRIEEDHYEADSLVLPMLFAYRHWLELRLKALILQGQRLQRDLLDPVWTHNLSALWMRVRQGLERSLPSVDHEAIAGVGNVIAQITEVDPGSEGFRYAITRREEPSLPDSLLQVDVRHLAAVMVQVANFLEATAEALAANLGALREWEDEVRDWDDIDY